MLFIRMSRRRRRNAAGDDSLRSNGKFFVLIFSQERLFPRTCNIDRKTIEEFDSDC